MLKQSLKLKFLYYKIIQLKGGNHEAVRGGVFQPHLLQSAGPSIREWIT